MRLAYLTPEYPKASHTFIRREILALEALGHEISRISIRRSAPGIVVDPIDKAELERTHVLLQAPISLLVALLSRLIANPLRSLRLLLEVVRTGLATGSGVIRPIAYFVEATRLLALCTQERVEHVHVHFGTNAATVAWIARRLGGPTYSMTIHGPDEWDAPVRHLLRQKIEASAFTAVISSYARAQAMRWIDPASVDRLHEIHCAVDDAYFDAAEPIAPDSPIQFVCVGRLTAQKGQLLLLHAFADLVRSGVDAKLVLAGDGELRSAIEATIARLGISERVEVTGWIDEQTVRAYLRASRCLVLPSFAEGLPVVIMEALALKRPVLSTYVAGIPELVRNGENGWLVPAGDESVVLEMLRRIAATPVSELQRMGELGASSVRERHSAKTEAAKLDVILRSVRDRNGA